MTINTENVTPGNFKICDQCSRQLGIVTNRMTCSMNDVQRPSSDINCPIVENEDNQTQKPSSS